VEDKQPIKLWMDLMIWKIKYQILFFFNKRWRSAYKTDNKLTNISTSLSSIEHLADITVLVLFCILFSGLAGCALLSETFSYSTPTPTIVNHTLQKTNEVTQLWSRTDTYLLSYKGDKTMDASAGKVCFLGDLQKDTLKRNMICMDSLTGTVLWNMESGVHQTISVAPEGIFVAYSSSASLRKYDFQTSELIWQKRLPGSGSEYLFLIDHEVQVATRTYTDTLSVLDMDGNVIKSLKDEQGIIISTPNETFVHLAGIRSINRNTGEVIWHDVKHVSALAPLFTQDKIFLRTGDFSGTAYALERKTGKLLWEVETIVGDLAYSPNKQRVYALREDGALLAIDENKGTTSIVAQFSGTPFLFIINGDAQAYQLAYDQKEHVLIVALGDGHQLFALKEK
jgi:outer membrane protein assembly factor BamB